jgi:hypothetical protein
MCSESGDEAPVPSQYSLRLNDSRNLFEGFPAQLLANSSEDLSLAVSELDLASVLKLTGKVRVFENLTCQGAAWQDCPARLHPVV